MKPVDGKLLIK